jgi:hypothetical protein
MHSAKDYISEIKLHSRLDTTKHAQLKLVKFNSGVRKDASHLWGSAILMVIGGLVETFLPLGTHNLGGQRTQSKCSSLFLHVHDRFVPKRFLHSSTTCNFLFMLAKSDS